MKTVSEHIRRAAAFTAASVSYALLSWIPIAGPAVGGLFMGYKFRGRALDAGLLAGLSAITGAGMNLYALYLFFSPAIAITTPYLLLMGWVFSVYHFANICVFALASSFAFWAASIGSKVGRTIGFEGDVNCGVEYAICPLCGIGKHASAHHCIGCQKRA